MSSSNPPFSDHIEAMARAVWGPDAHTSAWNGARRYVAAPAAATAHQLLPWSPAAIVAAGGRRSLDRPWTRRLRDVVGTTALLGRAAVRRREQLGIIPGEAPLLDVLRKELRLPIHTAVVLCGPPRANQKPVVQALDRVGRTLAFAKLGWNDLTRDLLLSEHATLRSLATASLGPVIAPRAIGSGSIGDVSWLALSPVGVRPSRRALTHADAADAIAMSLGSTTGPFATSPFAESLIARARDLPLAKARVRHLLDRYGDATTTFGAWHGDFVPWNISAGRRNVAVWDWERFTPGVPIGFDRLHFHVQVAVHRRNLAIEPAIKELAALVSGLVPNRDSADRALVLDAYLTELLVRYEHDSLDSPNPKLAGWCQTLAQTVTRPEVFR